MTNESDRINKRLATVIMKEDGQFVGDWHMCDWRPYDVLAQVIACVDKFHLPIEISMSGGVVHYVAVKCGTFDHRTIHKITNVSVLKLSEAIALALDAALGEG